MIFVLAAIAGMYVGRKIGWAVSKAFLYTSPTGVVVITCLLWGAAVAFAIHALIRWQQPNIVFKIIFGFALGAYVAIPNYGLIAESTIPDRMIHRHLLIWNLPFWTFILASVAFAFLL